MGAKGGTSRKKDVPGWRVLYRKGGYFYFACGFVQSLILLSRVSVTLRASDAVFRFCVSRNLRGCCVAGSLSYGFSQVLPLEDRWYS